VEVRDGVSSFIDVLTDFMHKFIPREDTFTVLFYLRHVESVETVSQLHIHAVPTIKVKVYWLYGSMTKPTM
jgi:hypothetical protein